MFGLDLVYDIMSRPRRASSTFSSMTEEEVLSQSSYKRWSEAELKTFFEGKWKG
jgi:hypothetical protein